MAKSIDKVYEDALATGLLPGASLLAGDKNGKKIYSKSLGKASLKAGNDQPFTENTICAIASMTKLMTSVAALQCVQDGLLSFDEPLNSLLQDMGKHGIITGWDDVEDKPILAPNSTPITLRMLLAHTSGHTYDWFPPLLTKWRASRNETPWAGATVAQKASLPLIFAPGQGWAYGVNHEWAGKAVEMATNSTLEYFMRKRIWIPLGIENDVSFWPEKHESMKDRLATISTLNEKCEGPAAHGSSFDMFSGTTDCLGGAGCYASAAAYFKFLTALLRRDPKLLTPDSYTELFKPQLDATLEKKLSDYIYSSPTNEQFLGLQVPESVRKNWSFAGLVMMEGQEGRFEKGAVSWGGVPSMQWWIDEEKGVCGVAACQIVPPMAPPIIKLHEGFTRGVYEMVQEQVG